MLEPAHNANDNPALSLPKVACQVLKDNPDFAGDLLVAEKMYDMDRLWGWGNGCADHKRVLLGAPEAGELDPEIQLLGNYEDGNTILVRMR